MRSILPFIVLLAACDDDAKTTAADTIGGDVDQNTLCAKYGGAGVIDGVVRNQIIPAIAGDCRISSFFTALSSDGLGHVVECLSIQVQGLFGCPGVTYAGSTDARGVPCRDMVEAHESLQLSRGDFDALIEDVVAGLTAAGVDPADIQAAAPALLGMAPDIVAQPEHTSPTHDLCE